MKWGFKQAERCQAKRMIIVGEQEMENGVVLVKDLEAREQVEVKLDDLH
jgi:histidyl-tRNA synthetase